MTNYRAMELGLVIGLLLGGRGGYAAPYDLVPRGDWTYDVLARWAARGLVDAGHERAAREFHGDEPLTREAMADLVVALAGHPERLPAGDQPLLLQILHEFSPEIRRARQDPDALLRSAE